MILEFIDTVTDHLTGKIPPGSARSGKWSTTRDAHLKLFPVCAVCSGTSKLTVHHIRPFHSHPELELDLTNLITLCESKDYGINCHLLVGHLGDFRSVNINAIEDSKTWNIKLANRPKDAKDIIE